MVNFTSTTRPRTLTETEQRKLLRITENHTRGIRDHVIFALALGTGLRVHEIAALNVGDVLGGDGKIKRRVQLRVFKRSARNGGVPQEVFLPDGVIRKLHAFLAKRETLEPEAPLFTNRKGERLSVPAFHFNFRLWQKRAGFEGHLFGFHTLRHTAATNLYHATKDIMLVRKQLRHKDVRTSAIYMEPSDEDLVDALKKLDC